MKGLNVQGKGFSVRPATPVRGPLRVHAILERPRQNDECKTACDEGKFIASIVAFPGEDAPGTGLRHFPAAVDFDARPTSDKHAMLTTKEYYQQFPTWVGASCPLTVKDQVPSGFAVRDVQDAGPTTGMRRRPHVADSTDEDQLDPFDHKTVSQRLKDLQTRHG